MTDLREGLTTDSEDMKLELAASRSSLAKKLAELLPSRAFMRSQAASVYGARAGSFLAREGRRDRKELNFMLTVPPNDWSSEQVSIQDPSGWQPSLLAVGLPSQSWPSIHGRLLGMRVLSQNV